MSDELNTNVERMRDEVLTGVHSQPESQSEAPPVEEVKEEPGTMNATTEENTQILKLIQDLQQKVATLATTNNRTNKGTTDGTPNPQKPL